jgi:hypothetical protein
VFFSDNDNQRGDTQPRLTAQVVAALQRFRLIIMRAARTVKKLTNH